MIGLAVAVMRNCAPESIFEKAFQHIVPTAPEVGLFLDECIFASYNQKWRDSHEELSMKSYEEEAEDFKMKQIYSHIASTEHKEGAVALWLHSLNHRNYPDLHDANEGAPIDGRSAQVDNMADSGVVGCKHPIVLTSTGLDPRNTSSLVLRMAAEVLRKDDLHLALWVKEMRL
ncbi:hypothetical protein RJ641_032539 [Dillenia turbinata]|uniref:Uncharacterized protein n=1 Tax=Dillenia turbinata TaxID=194707 RepID=A0AAN8ZIC8_9MAGN